MFLTNLIAGFAKSNISLWKAIDFHWFKNILLKLFSFQLCLYFFHKIIKLHKNICSAWISHTYAERFFVTDWHHMPYRNTIEISLILNVLLWILLNWYFKKWLTYDIFLCMWLDILLAKNWFSLFGCVSSTKLISS